MSSFIVANDTINLVVTWFHNQEFSTRAPYGSIGRPLEHIGYFVSNHDHCERLASDMSALNHEAYALRYNLPRDPVPSPFPHKLLRQAITPLMALKALHCWLYQCNEGHIPGTSPLYQTMTKLAGLIADRYISALPEYDALPWE
jgi:hypothetical protein